MGITGSSDPSFTSKLIHSVGTCANLASRDAATQYGTAQQQYGRERQYGRARQQYGRERQYGRALQQYGRARSQTFDKVQKVQIRHVLSKSMREIQVFQVAIGEVELVVLIVNGWHWY